MVETRAKRKDAPGRRSRRSKRSRAAVIGCIFGDTRPLLERRSIARNVSTQCPQVPQDRQSHALSPATNSEIGIRALFDDIANNSPGTRQAVPVPEVDLIASPTSPGEIRSRVKVSSSGGSTTTLEVPAGYDLLKLVKYRILGYLKEVVDENYNASETVDTEAQKE